MYNFFLMQTNKYIKNEISIYTFTAINADWFHSAQFIHADIAKTHGWHFFFNELISQRYDKINSFFQHYRHIIQYIHMVEHQYSYFKEIFFLFPFCFVRILILYIINNFVFKKIKFSIPLNETFDFS